MGFGRWLQNNAPALGTLAGIGASLIPGVGPVAGAALMAGGGTLGSLIKGSGAKGPQGPDRINEEAYRLIDLLGDREANIRDAERLAAAGAPGLDTYLAMQAAQGGSSVLAREQFEADQARNRAFVMDIFRQIERDRMALSTNLLGLVSQRDQFGRQLDQQNRQFKSQHGLGSQLLGVGATIAGSYFGGGGKLSDLIGKKSPATDPLKGIDTGAITNWRPKYYGTLSEPPDLRVPFRDFSNIYTPSYK